MKNMLQLPPIPTSILGLSDIEVEKAEISHNGEFIITVKSTKKEVKCKKCDNPTEPHGHGRVIRLRHLPIFDHITYIDIAPARGICKSCDEHPTTTQHSTWYNPGSPYTKAYEQKILMLLINSTVSDVSIKEDLGYKAIEAVVDRHIETEVNWDNIAKIGLLGIDEISLKKGYKDYVTLITSRTEGGVQIIAVLKGREKAIVKDFLILIPKSLKKTIDGVCTDMYDGFINAAKEALGAEIPIIADRYHVSKLYRKCLVSLRKKELKKLKKSMAPEEYKGLAPAISLLCRRKEYAMSEAEEKQLEPLFKAAPKIKEAYNLCLKLTTIYNKHSTPEEALESINIWIESVESSKLTSFKSFVQTLKKYKNEICNYFINRNSSGFVEGFNNKVKVLKRRCYGIFNLKHLFQRIFLDFSGYTFLNNLTNLNAVKM
jgi:transposase